MSYIKSNGVLASLIAVLSVGLTACQSESIADADRKYDCSSSATLAAAKANDKPWKMQKVGKTGQVAIDFSCTKGPFVGDFQQCNIELKYQDTPRFADAIAIDGGMKAHGHGLPTVPVLSPTAKAGHYKIEGLKYSMPGAWVVGFQVNVDDVTDQVVFDFTIE